MEESIDTFKTASNKRSCSRENKISLLKQEVGLLRDLCDKINPFEELSDEEKNILSELGISDYSDPYRVTNQLISRTEDTIEKLHHLEG